MTTYQPALCLQITARNVKPNRLYVIFAADGTQLAVIEDQPGTVPLWVTGLIQLAEVDVLPGEYKRWNVAGEAMRSSA